MSISCRVGTLFVILTIQDETHSSSFALYEPDIRFIDNKIEVKTDNIRTVIKLLKEHLVINTSLNEWEYSCHKFRLDNESYDEMLAVSKISL